jgi:UDP-N-acetylglucosamine 2-epimerase
VIRELQSRQVPFRWIDSGQHGEFTQRQREMFRLPEPDVCLSPVAEDVATIRRGFSWSGGLLLRNLLQPRWVRQVVFGGEPGVCVVHGDTFSTLLGTLFARRAGIQVAHLESGLRSHRYLSPFPEELIRVFCMRKSHLLLAPDEQAVANLNAMKVRGRVVNTGGNTVIDALRMYEPPASESKTEPERFVLATCHRLETIRSRKQLASVVACLNHVAESFHVRFVLHPPTQRMLQKFGLNHQLSPSIEQLPLQEYFEFLRLMQKSEFVVADGGTIQEECAALGVPLLIMRSRSERADGLGTNAVFADFDLKKVEQFVEQYDQLRGESTVHSPAHPSRIAADELILADH